MANSILTNQIHKISKVINDDSYSITVPRQVQVWITRDDVYQPTMVYINSNGEVVYFFKDSHFQCSYDRDTKQLTITKSDHNNGYYLAVWY